MSVLNKRLMPGLRSLVRDWRSGELQLLSIAIVIAVAAVASVSFLSDRVSQALNKDVVQSLGGDLVVRSGDFIPNEWLEQASSLGLENSITVEFPSMVSSDTATVLSSIKAVSDNYPLAGEFSIFKKWGVSSDTYVTSGAPKPGTVWVDPQVLQRFKLKPNDVLHVGDIELVIDKVIAYEPDRSMQFVNIAPRVLVNVQDLDRTGLLGLGSRASYRLLLKGGKEEVGSFHHWVEKQLKAGQEILTLENHRPELQRALNRAENFLSLVALLTILLAAVAIALSARRFNVRHIDGIAVMRCLGASKQYISSMLWTEFIAMAMLGSAVGIGAAWLVQIGLTNIVSIWMDITFPPATWVPYAKGLATGVLLLLGFAMPYLLQLVRVPPARVLNRTFGVISVRRITTVFISTLAFLALLVILTGNYQLGLIVGLGFVITMLVFAMVSILVIKTMVIVAKYFKRWPLFRFALTNMVRRRSMALIQPGALAAALTVVLLLTIMRTDLLNAWQNTVPPDAPNTFLINIQPDQKQDLIKFIESNGIKTSRLAPLIRARLTAINGKEIDIDSYSSERARSSLTREFNLSYQSNLPDSNKVVTGRWLNPDMPEISLESRMAERLQVGVGDTLTFNFAGQESDVKLVGLRKVKWDSFDVNFFALLSESVLKDMPSSYITSLRFPEDSGDLVSKLSTQFPNITVFDVTALLTQVQNLLSQVITAIQLLFMFTLAAGIAVFAAVLLVTREDRIYETAIMRALGAGQRQLKASLRLELLVVGVVAGFLSASAAQAISWVLAEYVFEFPLTLSLWPWLVGIVAGGLLSLLSGRLVLKGVLESPPLASLRAAQ